MYQYLIIFHSLFRWFVLAFLILAICKASMGYFNKRPYTKLDKALHRLTGGIAYTQFMIGIILYIISPITQYFWSNFGEEIKYLNTAFFGLYHSLFMFSAVMIVGRGSKLAKIKEADTDKFKSILICFSIALVIILIAIPWPFSPLANRPFIRPF